MAHSTAIPAVSQSTKAHSDWITFLCSTFINRLKAYGASLMVMHPADPTQTQIKAECPIHRGVSSRDGWETMNSALDWSRA